MSVFALLLAGCCQSALLSDPVDVDCATAEQLLEDGSISDEECDALCPEAEDGSQLLNSDCSAVTTCTDTAVSGGVTECVFANGCW